MLSGMLIMWFTLTVASLVFVIFDLYTTTPAPHIMKVAWILIVLYTGPIGLFIYLISCREPLPGTHDEFIKPLWKQAIGSEVHCLAGDATGIILAAIIISFFTISDNMEMLLEYLAGFLFGLFIFQALFMKDMMGETYWQALKKSFFPEWLSMNMIMAGMIPGMMIWRHFDKAATDPTTLSFWGSMALATIIGGIIAYPINHWLVANGLKHGMMTMGYGPAKMDHSMQKHGAHMQEHKVSRAKLFWMTLLTLVVLAIGVTIGMLAVSD